MGIFDHPTLFQEGFDLLPSPSALSRAGAQPLRLSLLHLGKLRPSQVWLDSFIGWRIEKTFICYYHPIDF